MSSPKQSFEAIEALASLGEHWALMAETDPAQFMCAVHDEIVSLRSREKHWQAVARALQRILRPQIQEACADSMIAGEAAIDAARAAGLTWSTPKEDQHE